MRIAISNIAWNVTEDERIAEVLRAHGLDAVDIAPGKYFPQPAEATYDEIAEVRDWWNSRGFEITGLQALLFGTTGLNLFGTPLSREAMLSHLGAVCRIAARLGAQWLVFGSPKNRDQTGLAPDEVQARATSFFRALGDIAGEWGVTICLEPNPVCYGANFMTTLPETAAMVEQIDHPAIRLQFDTGASAINAENPWDMLKRYAGLIGHVHASEPELAVLGNGSTDHAAMADALNHFRPHGLVSIEMLATVNEPHEVSVGRAVQVALSHYAPGFRRVG